MKRTPALHGAGAPYGSNRQEWVNRAQAEIMSLVDSRLAVAHAELEAALSENGVDQPGSTRRLHLDPHIISEATRHLLGVGIIKAVDHKTKGGRTVRLFIPGDTRDRKTAVDKVVRRKGMLVGRLNRLSTSVGEAGERVVRESLAATGDHITPEQPGYKAAATFLNVPLPGDLDSAAWVQVREDTTGMRSVYPVPIEVKNRQQTIYPIHREIHQLLYKSALLKIARPQAPIVPVLVCRRAHSRLFWMASDLGFLVTHFTDNRQYVSPTKDISAESIEQIRSGLGLPYLTVLQPGQPVPRIRQFFEQTLRSRAAATAARWAVTAPIILAYSKELRTENPDSARRLDLVRNLRETMQDELEAAGYKAELRSWSLPPLDD